MEPLSLERAHYLGRTLNDLFVAGCSLYCGRRTLKTKVREAEANNYVTNCVEEGTQKSATIFISRDLVSEKCSSAIIPETKSLPCHRVTQSAYMAAGNGTVNIRRRHCLSVSQHLTTG